MLCLPYAEPLLFCSNSIRPFVVFADLRVPVTPVTRLRGCGWGRESRLGEESIQRTYPKLRTDVQVARGWRNEWRSREKVGVADLPTPTCGPTGLQTLTGHGYTEECEQRFVP